MFYYSKPLDTQQPTQKPHTSTAKPIDLYTPDLKKTTTRGKIYSLFYIIH